MTLRRSEYFWSLTVTGLAVAVTYIPYVIGWLRQTPEISFSGILFNSIDANVYLAVMQEGWRGDWLMTLPFSVEPHQPFFLYEFYILLGHLARLLNLSVMTVYHLMRGVGGWGMLFATYEYLRIHVRSLPARKVAFLLICFGSGLGWLMQIVMPVGPDGISGIDFWLMDAYAFFSLMLVPHFTVAWAMAFVYLAQISGAVLRPTRWQWAAAFGSGLILAIVHPKLSPVIAVVAFATTVLYGWRDLNLLRIAAPPFAAGLLGMALPGLYYVYAVRVNPLFAILMAQDITMSPPIFYYAAGFGLVSLLSCFGGLWVIRHKDWRAAPLLVWVLIASLMLYIPVQIQRRFIMGLQVPLAALAGIGLTLIVLPALRQAAWARWLAHWYPIRRLRLLLVSLLIALTALSNILLVGTYSLSAWSRSPSMFIPTGVIQATNWLGQHATQDELTLAAYSTGNYIPAQSGARTCLGHWNLTIDFYSKQTLVERIFDEATDSVTREQLLQDTRCHFLFYGPAERQLGAFDPATANYLRLRYSIGDVQIYEVIH